MSIPNKKRGNYIRTEEHKKRIGNMYKGKRLSKYHKRKMSDSQKRIGNKPPIQKGRNHWNWKGGISPLHCRIRASKEYKLWRTAVFQKDSYTCVFCGERNGNGKKNYIER